MILSRECSEKKVCTAVYNQKIKTKIYCTTFNIKKQVYLLL
ncbi:hypothetical protein T190607A02C_10305 [Tenacibaculum sp. 190524A02b]